MDRVRTVRCGEHEICYVLEEKQVRNLNLRIRKDGAVCVSMNPALSAELADDLVRRKEAFIEKSVQCFHHLEDVVPRPKRYVTGESFTVLGRGLRLKVEVSEHDEVTSDGVTIMLRLRRPDDVSKKGRLMSCFLDEQCRQAFGEVLSRVYPIFRKYGIAYPQLKIRTMETRWGSCLAGKGVITLNRRLLEAPRHCIEYVVMHEFCHFIHPNHSKQFYLFLTMMMPDWQSRKAELERLASYGL